MKLLVKPGNIILENPVWKFGGDARIDTESGFDIRTHWFMWDIDSRSLVTHYPVEIQGEDLKITTIGAEVFLDRDRMKMTEEVLLEYLGLRVNSDRGRLFFKEDKIRFDGNVEGKGDFGNWTSRRALIRFRKNKKGKPALTNLLFEGDVIFHSREDESLVIRSRELELNRKKRRKLDPSLMARGGVRATQGEPPLRMEAENFSILERRDGSEEILLEGDVTLRSRNRVAKSKLARIRLSSGKVNLYREASIRAHGDKLLGQQIIFFLDNDRVVVKKASGTLKGN